MEDCQLSADIRCSFLDFRYECSIRHELRLLKKNNMTHYHFYFVLLTGMQRHEACQNFMKRSEMRFEMQQNLLRS
jgi:hypothetical protein